MESHNRSNIYEAIAEFGSGSAHSKFDYYDFNPQTSDNSSLFSSEIPPANVTTMPSTRDEFLAKIEQSVLALIFVLTIVGNFLVLMGIYFRKQKMTRMYYFILHLSIADLTTAFFQVLTQLFWEITYRFQGGSFMCKFVKYTQILGPYSSSYILVMTAVDRYQAICYPLSNCSWTARRSKLMLGIAWTLAFLCCLPQLYIFSYQEITPDSGVFDCWGTFAPNWGEKAYITWYCITVFIIPLIILIFAYTCITRIIWLNFSMKNAATTQEQCLSRSTKEDSEEADENEFDNSIEENETSVFHENDRNSEKALNDRKMYTTHGDSIIQKPRNLEVSWHQSMSGVKTRTAMSSKPSPAQFNELSSPVINNKCQLNGDRMSPDIVQESQGAPFLAEETQYLSNISPCNKNKAIGAKSLNIQNVPSYDTQTNYSDHDVRTGTTEKSQTVADTFKSKESKGIGKRTESEKRHRWRSVSMSSNNSHSLGLSGNSRKEANGSTHQDLKDPNLSLLTPTKKVRRAVSKKVSKPLSVKASLSTNYSQPRTHSVKGISRAKIKTIKLTVTVICCYIICSTPFIAALLWSAYDPYAKEHPFFYGPTFAILTLLASLNSCANAWIVLFFNPNLLQSFVRGTCGRVCPSRPHSDASASMSASHRKQLGTKTFLGVTNSNQPVTSVTGLSPLMNRLSHKEYTNNRSKNAHDVIELIHPGRTMVTTNSASRSYSVTSRNRNNCLPDRSREAETPIETSFIGI